MPYGITNDFIFGETMAALNAGQPQGIVGVAIYNKALDDVIHVAECLKLSASQRGRIPERSSMQWMVWQLSREADRKFTLRKEAEMAAIRASGVLDTREVRKVGR